MRMRRKPNLIPRMERCARVLISDPEVQRGNWRALMPEAETVYLELGCGKGRFTAETAEQNPKALYIAVERVPDAMVIAMERVCAKELHNVFFVDGDAAQLPQFFAPGEVSRIYINFCDPWPGNRHAKRRLTHPNFLNLYRQIQLHRHAPSFCPQGLAHLQYMPAPVSDTGFAGCTLPRSLLKRRQFLPEG